MHFAPNIHILDKETLATCVGPKLRKYGNGTDDAECLGICHCGYVCLYTRFNTQADSLAGTGDLHQEI